MQGSVYFTLLYFYKRSDFMEKLKKIAKYTTNILGIIAALVAGINSVEGITIPYAIQIVGVIAVVQRSNSEHTFYQIKQLV